ncbi:hypothetical protein protein [Bacillus cereus G9241]|nr:hypothetical protein protein [Bacillus cereus G9241]
MLSYFSLSITDLITKANGNVYPISASPIAIHRPIPIGDMSPYPTDNKVTALKYKQISTS